MEKQIIIYYLIGLVISLFNIWYYRYSKYKTQPKISDAIAALLGIWVWPIQLILFTYTLVINNKRNRAKH